MEEFKDDNSTEDEIEIRIDGKEKSVRQVDTLDSITSSNYFSPRSTLKSIPSPGVAYETLSAVSKQSKYIPLVADDREIPDFLANERRGDYAHLKPNSFVNSTSKSSQTQISGVREAVNVLLTSELNQPATPVHSIRKKSAVPNRYAQELMLTRSQLSNLHRKYQLLKSRFHRLHSDYYKLMNITGELTTSLSNSIYRQPVSIEATLKNCMRIYPELFSANIRDDLPEFSLDNELESKRSLLSTVPLSPKQLNYRKIKFHLINANVKTKLLLLQALRWKITLSQPDERDEVVNEYISNDLLGLHAHIGGDSGKSILPYLLVPLELVQPHVLQQSSGRLLNAFASLKCGRDYLAIGPAILNVVVQCLDSTRADSMDSFTCDMIIAMLQKLSLRRHQRLYMIASGLVEWLIHHLKAECHTMGTYRLEYATALLMNLSLHKEAQVRAAAMATMVISTLITLLSTDHMPALPYINGALNSFLANSSINEEARLIGLGPILEYHRKHRTGELRKHLEYILMRHRRQPNETIEESFNDDDDREEFDVLEDELDEMDPVKVDIGDLFGETLLSSCYSQPKPHPAADQSIITCKSPTIVYQTQESTLQKGNEFSNTGSTLKTSEKEVNRESSTKALDSLISPLCNIVQDGDFAVVVSSISTATRDNHADFDRQEDEEEAFAAKPKITRTPPQTAKSENG